MNGLSPKIVFTEGLDMRLLSYIHPMLLMIMGDMATYMDSNGERLRITSLVRPYGDGSKSTTHQTGRAFDFSVLGIDDNFIKDMVAHFNKKYEAVAAISGKTGDRRLIYIHGGEGTGLTLHGHVQLSREYTQKH